MTSLSAPCRTRGPACRALVALLLGAASLRPARASAQVVGVHGLYVPSSDTRRASLGVGGDVGHIVSLGPVGLWGALALEYQRQRNLGPGRGRVSADLRLVPGGRVGWLVPLVGGSVSANRSGGAQSEWPGTRLGLDALAGVVLIPSHGLPVGISIEERFGYVRGLEHALATRVGLRLGFY